MDEQKAILAPLENILAERNRKALLELLNPLHPADIAELFDDLEAEDQSFIISVLGNEVSAAVLMELEEDERKQLLKNLSAKQIAQEVIYEMDSDDAADVIGELSDDKKEDVIKQLQDQEQARDIVDLLRYDINSAGGIMGKELVKVNKEWNVIQAVRAMRKQAEFMEEVYSIYVIDNQEQLLGTLSLKKLLTTSSQTKVEQVLNQKIHAVSVNTNAEEVASVMQKYDLVEMPVVDELGRLVGRITVDDVLDVMREEAERDYQLAAGITQDVEANDTILDLTKARLPWLILGLFGGIAAAYIMGDFEEMISKYAILFYFTPLIAAMAGNVGVQSSAIIVQGLANNEVKGSVSQRLIKEVQLAMLNGFILSILLFLATWLWKGDYTAAFAISISLLIVIVIAGLIGTFVPLFLNKQGIDPAIATGPFITTSNDVVGITIYFLIAKLVLGI